MFLFDGKRKNDFMHFVVNGFGVYEMLVYAYVMYA